MVINLAINGFAGRMGSRIVEMADASNGVYRIVCLLDLKQATNLSAALISGTDPERIADPKIDVVIDFTVPEATLRIAQSAAKYKKPMVIGTTGFNLTQDEELKKILKEVPVVKSANMSMGVNVFFKVAQEIARTLPAYDVRVQEVHHTQKLDNPSGTAKQVAELIRKITGHNVTVDDGKRIEGVVGEHRVIFSSPTDTIEIFHHAETRDIFAQGALEAAKWLADKRPGPGLYSMQDVLGLK